jgi:hypothetical protein
MQDQVNALMRSRIQAILDQCQWNSSTPLSQYYANITETAASMPLPPLPVPQRRSRLMPVVLGVLLLLLLVGIAAMYRLPAEEEDYSQSLDTPLHAQ